MSLPYGSCQAADWFGGKCLGWKGLDENGAKKENENDGGKERG
jgi:hypothetical protein